MSWQPIETAPKDGTRILIYRAEWMEDTCICFWNRDFAEWKVVGGGTPWHGATHWMKLPEPPKENE